MKKLFVCIIALICFSCHESSRHQISDIIKEWSDKEIIFPENSVFVSIKDTVACNPRKQCLKILTYTNSNGCIGCRMMLKQWLDFNKELLIIDSNLLVLKFVSPNFKEEVFYELKNTGYYFPVCIDVENQIDNLNHFPDNENFHCFLLDENNRVILIGNPVQNPKIRDLYIRTICERLGIKPEPRLNAAYNNFSKSLGTFNWQTEQRTTFSIHNTDTAPMLIDTVYTSCECTTAEIDKQSILEGDSAIISVSFKAEKPEQFMREVYVGVHGGDEIVLSIEGVAVE